LIFKALAASPTAARQVQIRDEAVAIRNISEEVIGFAKVAIAGIQTGGTN
jgi:hypothetical protein